MVKWGKPWCRETNQFVLTVHAWGVCFPTSGLPLEFVVPGCDRVELVVEESRLKSGSHQRSLLKKG